MEAQHDSRPVLAAFGDSLVAGWGLDARDALPARLEEELAALGLSVRVLDFGVSGDTSPEGLERLEEVLEAKPSAVLLEFGANDCFQGLPLEETWAALDRMVLGLKQAGAKVFLAGWRTRADLFAADPELAGLVPLAPPLFTPRYVEHFNQLHARLAEKHGLPLLPYILGPLEGQPGCFQADGVHPNAKGARILAQALAPLLLPLLAEGMA